MKVVIVLTGAAHESEAKEVLKHSILQYDSSMSIVECNDTFGDLEPLLNTAENLLLLSPFSHVKNSIEENILPLPTGGEILVAAVYENPPVHPRMAGHYPTDDDHLNAAKVIRNPFASTDAMLISTVGFKALVDASNPDRGKTISEVVNSLVSDMVDFGLNEVYRPDKYLYEHRVVSELRSARYHDKRATISIFIPNRCTLPVEVDAFVQQQDVAGYCSAVQAALHPTSPYRLLVESLASKFEAIRLQDEIIDSVGFSIA